MTHFLFTLSDLSIVFCRLGVNYPLFFPRTMPASLRLLRPAPKPVRNFGCLVGSDCPATKRILEVEAADN